SIRDLFACRHAGSPARAHHLTGACRPADFIYCSAQIKSTSFCAAQKRGRTSVFSPESQLTLWQRRPPTVELCHGAGGVGPIVGAFARLRADGATTTGRRATTSPLAR